MSALTGIRPQVANAEVLGAIAGVVALALLAAFLVKVKPRVTPRLVAIVALAPLSWAIIALGRADGGDPFASRYVYASAIFILMAVLEIARGDFLPRLFRGWKFVALALVVCVSVTFSAKTLFEKGSYWRSVSQYVQGRTAAIELTRRTIDPNLMLEPLPDMAHMTAGWYLNAVERYGESPTGAPDISALGEQGRSAADQVLAAGAPAQYVSPPAGSEPAGVPPTIDLGRAKRSGSCLVTRPGSPLSVVVPPSGILIRPSQGHSATVLLRRYASAYDAAPAQAVGEPTLLVIAADHSDVPWHAEVTSNARVSLCGVPANPRLRRGPRRPPSGDQHCSTMSIAEAECRFRRD